MELDKKCSRSMHDMQKMSGAKVTMSMAYDVIVASDNWGLNRHFHTLEVK